MTQKYLSELLNYSLFEACSDYFLFFLYKFFYKKTYGAFSFSPYFELFMVVSLKWNY